MNASQFVSNDFFSLQDFPYGDVFDGIEQAWEVLPRIETYILEMFSSGKIKPNYKGTNNVYVGEGTVIQNGAEIIGPTIIGKNCIISHASLLRGNCLLGDNVKIGHAVEVKNSLFFNNATAAHLNYIGDSIIGNNVNISGGAILANYRLDKELVTVKTEQGKIATHLQKFGAVVGDNSNIGVNAVLNPGTVLGKNTVVFPLTLVTGYHTDNTIIK